MLFCLALSFVESIISVNIIYFYCSHTVVKHIFVNIFLFNQVFL
jgi:hypothetical protein